MASVDAVCCCCGCCRVVFDTPAPCLSVWRQAHVSAPGCLLGLVRALKRHVARVYTRTYTAATPTLSTTRPLQESEVHYFHLARYLFAMTTLLEHRLRRNGSNGATRYHFSMEPQAENEYGMTRWLGQPQILTHTTPCTGTCEKCATAFSSALVSPLLSQIDQCHRRQSAHHHHHHVVGCWCVW